jgi:SAM-dependent methyltransferase
MAQRLILVNDIKGETNMDQDYLEYGQRRLGGGFGQMGSWKLVLPFLQNKKTLDIGCSDGLYLEQLSRDSMGIEQLPNLVQAAKEKNLNVINMDVMSGLSIQKNNSFEAVLFSHVMEHLERPIDALKEIYRILAPGGTLVLGLPTENNIFRFLLRHDYFNGTHIYSFSIRNSKKLLEMNGFSVDKIYFHLPKFKGKFGEKVHVFWNAFPIFGKEWLSMAYWIVATKLSK